MNVKYSGDNIEFFELPLYKTNNNCFNTELSFLKLNESIYSPENIILNEVELEFES